MQKHTLHVSGTHCPSCKILIEDILSEDSAVDKVHMNLKTKQVTLETDEQDEEKLARMLSEKTASHGYVFSTEKIAEKPKHDLLWQAIPIGLVLLMWFLLLQKSGILSIGIGGAMSPATAVIIGLIASVSSCLAVVGGLVLSLSAKVAKDDMGNRKPFVLFHAGRIVSFAFFGGLLGLIGGVVGVNYLFSAILGLFAAIVMIALGFNLMGIFRKGMFTLPSHLFSFFRKVEHETFAPLLIGAGTFFLPCGFTQSMQVAALSSGSAVTGSLIMLSFALGTLPVLAGLSFGSASLAQSRHAPLFFRVAGVVVLGLGTIALITGLSWLGIIPPLFSI